MLAPGNIPVSKSILCEIVRGTFDIIHIKYRRNVK